jgi:HAD superfamily hydrolase (TIGR01549 family)
MAIVISTQAHVTTVAIDLMDTLVEYQNPQFVAGSVELLAAQGCDISATAFQVLFRQRYLEYSMGNYAQDSEFLEVLAADLSGNCSAGSLTSLVELRLNLSTARPGATEFLEFLAASYETVLATNFVSDWAKRIISANDWARYLDIVAVSSDIHCRKPSARFFEFIMANAKAQRPTDVVFIGDSFVNDIYGATRFGMQAILLDRAPGDRPPGDVARHPAGVSYRSVSSLSQVVGIL